MVPLGPKGFLWLSQSPEARFRFRALRVAAVRRPAPAPRSPELGASLVSKSYERQTCSSKSRRTVVPAPGTTRRGGRTAPHAYLLAQLSACWRTSVQRATNFPLIYMSFDNTEGPRLPQTMITFLGRISLSDGLASTVRHRHLCMP